jgi:hypothetical protein
MGEYRLCWDIIVAVDFDEAEEVVVLVVPLKIHQVEMGWCGFVQRSRDGELKKPHSAQHSGLGRRAVMFVRNRGRGRTRLPRWRSGVHN